MNTANHAAEAIADAAKFARPIALNGAPIDASPILPLLARIISVLRPFQIWLFGSRARGEAALQSDWDLLVVMSDGTADADLDPMVGWRLRKESGVRADVVLCRAGEFDEDRGTPNTLEYEVATQGVLLYEQ